MYMQGLSVNDFTKEETAAENCSFEGYVSCSDLCQPRNVFEEDYRHTEARNRWLDDYGWL